MDPLQEFELARQLAWLRGWSARLQKVADDVSEWNTARNSEHANVDRLEARGGHTAEQIQQLRIGAEQDRREIDGVTNFAALRSALAAIPPIARERFGQGDTRTLQWVQATLAAAPA